MKTMTPFFLNLQIDATLLALQKHLKKIKYFSLLNVGYIYRLARDNDHFPFNFPSSLPLEEKNRME